jgi:hypothetical protein
MFLTGGFPRKYFHSAVDIVLCIGYCDTVNMATDVNILETPVQQMLDRGKKTLETVLSMAGSTGLGGLQTTTNEVGYLMAVAQLAIESLGITADVTERKLLDARLRGLKRMAELRKAAEPVLESGQVCDVLGVSREAVSKKVARKQLLALPRGGDRVYPAFQFQDGEVVPWLSGLLNALETNSPFVVLAFLLTKNPVFGGKSAFELLQAGDLESVMTEARGYLNHGS